MLTIGKKALTILKGISIINQSIILNSKSLYTKYEDSLEVKGKGQSNIIVEYKLPEGEIVLPQEFGIFNINEFLAVINSFDNESLKMTSEGNTIIIADNRKKTTYYTQGVDSLPIKNPKGDELFASAETKMVFALTEVDIDQLKADLNTLDFDKLILKAVDNKLSLISDNSISSNNTKIDINEKFVSKAEGEFIFPNTDIFSVLMSDNYKVYVKEASLGDNKILICKFIATSIDGLSYTLVSTD